MQTLNQLFTQLDQVSDDRALSPRNASARQTLSPLAKIAFAQWVADSRQIQPNDAFVLLKSQTPNAPPPPPEKISQYLAQAANRQAAFVVSEVALDQAVIPAGLPVLYAPDVRDYLGTLVQARLQHGKPVQLPHVVAVTGTNGKTTVSQLIAQLMHAHGQRSAVMGTAGNGILPNLTPSTHTTLEVLAMQQQLHAFASQGVRILAIEASSHGLHQQRLQAMPIEVAIFTNLSRDHLDYHHDMADYAAAKARLFDRDYFTSLTHAVINLDDAASATMQTQARQTGVTVWTYSLQDPTADLFATDIAPSLAGVDFTLHTPQGKLALHSPLLGRFNVANLLAAIGGALALGVQLDELPQAVASLAGASGRMQRIDSAQGGFIVDYAHTPDALMQVLASLRAHCVGKLWAVVGCGGDRDAGKRPLMTQAALDVADAVILTADNPRSEDPLAILADMQAGLSDAQRARVYVEPDRRAAIAYAVTAAGQDDLVVIAGKGHETYQEINGVRHDFDDRVVVAQALAAAGKA
ncbi:UDP-N-acetylmuramoyl-L-alanyl-D-glutamate--2,6-diaminopimelate ligase [Faucicola atlantae]|uniref:UDP-N-acetylmuramoyl-L-alanyl-D-glutamate--2, 6-diaminopimelate ligase n=1 Tax=Faucicola atlantae TaxID=34059 RepID=UPI0009F54E89|nr:UDP-N-acetylmuramoyl-L-alanyl-D-glutamate--2,6-diaminopimelate ligase [Moraxella atlantae]